MIEVCTDERGSVSANGGAAMVEPSFSAGLVSMQDILRSKKPAFTRKCRLIA